MSTTRSEAVHTGVWPYDSIWLWGLPGGMVTGMVTGALEHGTPAAVDRLESVAADAGSLHGAKPIVQLTYDHAKRWGMGPGSTAGQADFDMLAVWAARSLPHPPRELSGAAVYDDFMALQSARGPVRDVEWSIGQYADSVPDLAGRWYVSLYIGRADGGGSTFLPLNFTTPRAAFRELASAVARRPLVDMNPWRGHEHAAGDLLAKAATYVEPAEHGRMRSGGRWRILQADAHAALFTDPPQRGLFDMAEAEPTPATPEPAPRHETPALAPVAVLERPTLF